MNKDKKSELDDVIIESDDTLDDSVVAEESVQETIKKLREKLKKAVAEKQEYLDGWQRSKADFVNYKKRVEEEVKQIVKFANEGLIEELVPVLDSFGMAFQNKESWEKVDKNWRTGVEYIHGKLISALTSSGLKEINPINEKFDPMRDEALEFIPVTDERQDHVITEVVQKGYSLNGRIIKAPKVKVGEFKKP